MTTTLEHSYQPLQPYEADGDGPEETPHEIHVVPEESKSKGCFYSEFLQKLIRWS